MPSFNGSYEILATDPTTGISKKIQAPDIVGAGLPTSFGQVQYTSTGQVAEPTFTITTPRAVQAAWGSTYTADGVWITSDFTVDPQTTTFELANVVAISSYVNKSGLNKLTSMSFPTLTFLGGWGLYSCSLLNTLSFPNLVFIDSSFASHSLASLTSLSLPSLVGMNGNFNTGLSALTTLSLPELTYVASFNPYSCTALSGFSLPKLAKVYGTFSPSGGSVATVFSFPSLTFIQDDFHPNSHTVLTSITMPELTFIGGTVYPETMASLTAFSLPKIESIAPNVTTSQNVINFNSGTANLADFALGSTLKKVGGTAGNVNMTSCALTQESVDGLLVRLAALDGTNGTTAFSNRTITITGTSAAPGATGLAAKSVLVARGCTVTHN